MLKTNRREFLKTSGCLVIGFSIGNISSGQNSFIPQELPQSIRRYPDINAWIEVLANGKVRVFTGKAELGQGIRTAIAQVAAEELELSMENVEVVLADTLRTPNEGYTVGSGSIEQSAMAVRYASAAAKMKLLELASDKLKVPVDELVTTNGKVYTKNGRNPITFSEILDGKQISGQVKEPVKLKAKSEYRLSGKPVPREDIGWMVRAHQNYLHDLRFPGMVHARVVRPPVYGAKLKTFDAGYVKKKVPGVLKTVNDGNFLAVIATDEYEAMRAQKVLGQSATWTEAAKVPATEKDLKEYILKLPVETDRVQEKGKITSEEFTHTATYFKPYIMHGSTGPSCSVAIWHNEKLHIWSHSQGIYPLREAIAQMLQMPADKIEITGVPGSGCYGHNGADDVAAEAAIIAMAYPGKHVRLQWSREEEHGWEPYGSAMVVKVGATLDATGKILYWKYDLWSDSHSSRPGGRAENLLPARYIKKMFTSSSKGYIGGATRNSEPYYSIPNQQVNANFFRGPLRVSALRSLGAYGNIFALESFMDELADNAKKDPFDFRLMHLTDQRAKDVVQKLGEMVSNVKPGDGEGLGIAFSRYKNSASYCTVAALVHVDTTAKTLRLKKMWSAIDAGEVINTDGLKNQTEGGMIQAASWTLKEHVKFDGTNISSTDWGTYPILRFSETPEVEVEIIPRQNEEVMGAGEAAQGPAGAAIVNAIFRACGKRIRDLPVKLFQD
ncbi:MAG: xanthine dehydrogenase family protein molybdopterin-binding subunit [Chitinophagaceae bacterium]|nr:xanthine dehydrogenase family protein molybdopterin-binding subunit [Chitinophagaceae bacterium]